MSYLIALARTAGEEAEVPVSFHLDHGFTVEMCIQAVDAGFPSVMIDASMFGFETNIKMTRIVFDYAHEHGVVVEGEPRRRRGDDRPGPSGRIL